MTRMAGVHGAYIEQNLLAPTSTVSASMLIGPAVCYTGVHTFEYVCQNCVLARCANFVFQSQCHMSLLYFFCFLKFDMGKLKITKKD